MKTRFYFCNQKRSCRTSAQCGRDCFLTKEREYRAAAVDYDDKELRMVPVSHADELRGYILEKEKEGGL